MVTNSNYYEFVGRAELICYAPSAGAASMWMDREFQYNYGNAVMPSHANKALAFSEHPCISTGTCRAL